MKSIRIALIFIAVFTSACSGLGGTPSAVASTPPAATAPTASPSSPLEGIWATPQVTCDQQVATIHEAGFTDDQIAASGWVCSAAYFSLRFLGDQLGQFQKSAEGAWERGSGGSYKLTDDHTIVEADSFDPSSLTTLSFTLVGDLLTVTSVSTDSDLSAQIAVAAIYLTAPFAKES
ncbi:MAG: hypothetical protein ABIO99_06110 [Candidatus Limnocylindria bacterium]